MNLDLDKIIDKCIDNILFEAAITPKNDYVVRNAQNQITKHLKDLYKKGDERLTDLMSKKGYIRTFDKNDAIKKIEQVFKNYNISDDVMEDVLNVVKILKTYVNHNGVINFNRMKEEHPDDYDRIIRVKNFIDLKGLTYLYDRSANLPSNTYGINWKGGGDESSLDFNSITDSEADKYRGDKIITLSETKLLMKQRILDQYLEATYGVKSDIPTISMVNGNSKLPDNTLIINFTSALNCPAWNECLVKHSCYARAGEKRTPTAFRGNENRSLYWLTTEHDSKLLSLMMDFVRTYCFNYDKVAKHLIINNMVKTKNQQSLAKKISLLPLDDSFFTPEIIEVMKMYKRIDYIRLNENGDFIGQWLVDAWDNEAGKYQTYGINVSAYTCRHLNYEGIKNIILNVSYDKNSTNGNIARHFIALPEKVYDALDETYGGKANTLIYNGRDVIPNPQLLYDIIGDELEPNGKIYYKCPCGRESNGVKISCYQCNLCYNPKDDNRELFVFVKAHGSNGGHLKGYDLIKSGIGVSKNYLNKMKYNKDIRESNEVTSNSLNMMKRNGIKCIVNNAINSTYNHFSALKNGKFNESKTYKISQDDLIKMIKESLSNHMKISD